MLLFKTSENLTEYIKSRKAEGKTIGFVPTMGALHEGHLSLIRQSGNDTDTTVCSIFVNPTQFNDPNDFKKYPVTIEKDIELLIKAGTDVLFLPSVETIYPNGTAGLQHYELGELEHVLEGKYRPGHFQGVCQVMHRLLELVAPEHLFMGRKDYQQCMVVGKLIRLLNMATKLHPCPTLRETDGLAMSSRNMRLSPEEREKAVAVSRALLYIRENIQPGHLEELKEQAGRILEKEQFRIDYVEIADAQQLELISSWNGSTPLVALIAAFMGDVRLIDNMDVSN